MAMYAEFLPGTSYSLETATLVIAWYKVPSGGDAVASETKSFPIIAGETTVADIQDWLAARSRQLDANVERYEAIILYILDLVSEGRQLIA